MPPRMAWLLLAKHLMKLSLTVWQLACRVLHTWFKPAAPWWQATYCCLSDSIMMGQEMWAEVLISYPSACALPSSV